MKYLLFILINIIVFGYSFANENGKIFINTKNRCGVILESKNIENSVIKNEVKINGKKIKGSCFKDKTNSINLGVYIDKNSKIKNSVIKNKTIINGSEIIINGKKIIK